MPNDFDESVLSELGFLINEKTADYLILVDKGTENEIVIWKLGDWLQFRCNIFGLGALK